MKNWMKRAVLLLLVLVLAAGVVPVTANAASAPTYQLENSPYVSYVWANGTSLVVETHGIYIDADKDGVHDEGETKVCEYRAPMHIYAGQKTGDLTVSETIRITVNGGEDVSIIGSNDDGGTLTAPVQLVVNGGTVNYCIAVDSRKSHVGTMDITVNGGRIDNLYAGSYGSGDVRQTGDATVTMTGGYVYNFFTWHGGTNNGNVSLNMSGGTINNLNVTGYYNSLEGNVDICVTGGTVINLRSREGTISGNVNVTVLTPVSEYISPSVQSVVDNLLVRKADGDWIVQGDVSVPAGATLTIPAGYSLTIPEGCSLTNNGTIVNNGSFVNDGTFTNNGTVTCNSHTYRDSKCMLCGALCPHEKRNAPTCLIPETCVACGATSGNVADHSYDGVDWTSENRTHYKLCVYGCGTKAEVTDCTGVFTASSAVLTETCSGCYGQLGTLILGEPDDLVYDGNPKDITVTNTTSAGNLTISYCCEGGCILPGDHTASITVGGATATVSFSIDKAVPTAADFTVSAPGTSYDGIPKSATAIGAPGTGEITLRYYRDGEEVTPIEPGTYTVKLSVEEGQYYYAAEDLTDSNWTLTIYEYDVIIRVGDQTVCVDGEIEQGAEHVDHSRLLPGHTITIPLYSTETDQPTTTGKIFSDNENIVVLDENGNDVTRYYSFGSAFGTLTVVKHTGGTATCTELAVCSACGESYGSVDAGNHTGVITYTANSFEGTHTGTYSCCGGTFTEDHTCTYDISGASITESCSVCRNSATITLMMASDPVYDGQGKGVSGTGEMLSDAWLYAEYDTADGSLPVNAGTYTAEIWMVQGGEAQKLHEEPAVVIFTIVPKELTVTITGSTDKVYEGTADVYGLSLEVSGIVGTDDVTVSADGFTYDSKDAGERTVTANGVTLSGADAANYTVAEVTTTGTIFPMEVVIADAVVADKSYDGTVDAMIIAVDYSGFVSGDDVLLSGTAAFDSAASGENKTVTVTFALTGTDTGNYELVTGSMETTASITKRSLEEIMEPLDGVTTENVTSDNDPFIDSVREELEHALTDPGLTEEEKQAMEEALDQLDQLDQQIDEAYGAVAEDSVMDTMDVTGENVTPEDQEKLESARDVLEDALENYGDNYTEEEKQIIQDQIDRIDGALDTLENAQQVTEQIQALPDTVEPDDEETTKQILAAADAYNALTDYEKSLVSAEDKTKLDALLAAAVDYKIVKGNGATWTSGDLSFTANGSFDRFVEVRIDGKLVDAEHYTAVSGSTVITLSEDYLKTLRSGNHTISIVFGNGQADGNFIIKPAASSPTTGDEILTAMGLLCFSALALVALIAGKKRRTV